MLSKHRQGTALTKPHLTNCSSNNKNHKSVFSSRSPSLIGLLMSNHCPISVDGPHLEHHTVYAESSCGLIPLHGTDPSMQF